MKIKKVNEMIDTDSITHVIGKKINDSVPVTNSRKISQWFVDNSMSSHKEGHISLLKNLITELTELFGVYNKGMRLEFLTKVWILKYKDLTFNIFTAKGKGTSIEVCDLKYEDIRNGKYENEIIEFLQKLYELINK